MSKEVSGVLGQGTILFEAWIDGVVQLRGLRAPRVWFQSTFRGSSHSTEGTHRAPGDPWGCQDRVGTGISFLTSSWISRRKKQRWKIPWGYKMVFKKKKKSSIERLFLEFDLLPFPLAFLGSFLFTNKIYFKVKCLASRFSCATRWRTLHNIFVENKAQLSNRPWICAAIVATGWAPQATGTVQI